MRVKNQIFECDLTEEDMAVLRALAFEFKRRAWRLLKNSNPDLSGTATELVATRLCKDLVDEVQFR